MPFKYRKVSLGFDGLYIPDDRGAGALGGGGVVLRDSRISALTNGSDYDKRRRRVYVVGRVCLGRWCVGGGFLSFWGIRGNAEGGAAAMAGAPLMSLLEPCAARGIDRADIHCRDTTMHLQRVPRELGRMRRIAKFR